MGRGLTRQFASSCETLTGDREDSQVSSFSVPAGPELGAEGDTPRSCLKRDTLCSLKGSANGGRSGETF